MMTFEPLDPTILKPAVVPEDEMTPIAQKLVELKRKTYMDVVGDKLFGFYMLVACNVVMSIFSCDVQRFLEEMYVVHLIAIMTLYFSVVLIDNNNNNNTPDEPKTNPVRIIVWTMMLYFLFLLSTHCHFRFFFASILVIFTTFVMQNIRGYLEQLQRLKPDVVNAVPGADPAISFVISAIAGLQLTSEFVVAALVIFGFLVYLGEQTVKYSDWTWVSFWFDSPCRKSRTGARGVALLAQYGYLGLAFHGLKRLIGLA